jgi:hypothetical protein
MTRSILLIRLSAANRGAANGMTFFCSTKRLAAKRRLIHAKGGGETPYVGISVSQLAR